MSSLTKMFVPRAVILSAARQGKTLLPLQGGAVNVDLSALTQLPKASVPSFQESLAAEAEARGHTCQDWEPSFDEESPSVWCPGCSYLARWHSARALQKSFLEDWLRGSLPRPSAEELAQRAEAQKAARWTAWVRSLPSWDLDTLRAGGVAASLLVKTSFYSEKISWCARLDAEDPDWWTRVAERPTRPAPPAPSAPAAAGAGGGAANWRRPLEPAPPAGPAIFGGVSAEEWLVSRDQRPLREREAEVQAWLDVKKNVRPIYTGGAPLRGVAVANSSSLLVTGFGPEVGLSDIRRLAALVGPVRDIHRPRGSPNTVFVEMLQPEAAARAKAIFTENPVVIGGRRLTFDISVRDNSARYAGRR
jgi:hypothetical protein